MVVTKDQERKALEQIRRIVAELGEDSYIAIAFEGCFDIASANIDNDLACSMKQQRDDARHDAEVYNGKMKAYIEEAQALRKERDEREMEYDREAREWKEQLRTANGEIITLRNAVAVASEQRDDTERQLQAANGEILKLKAKLFDLLYAE